MKINLFRAALCAIALATPWAGNAVAQQPSAQNTLWTSFGEHVEEEIALTGCNAALANRGCSGGCQNTCEGSGIYNNCCSTANDCGSAWLTLDYLLWQVSGYGVPALVTSSPPGTLREDSGVLPNATILFGNDELADDLRSGARIRLGYWFDACQTSGLEGSFLALGEENSGFFAQSDGSTGSLNRPFFNSSPNVDAQDSLVIGFDDENGMDGLVGSTTITSSSNLYSAHAAYRRNVLHSPCHRVDLTLGYRYFQLDETLRINDDLTADGPAGDPLAEDTNLQIEDLFETSNEFHGAELGLVSMNNYGRWSTELILKVALGNNFSHANLAGSSTFTPDGGMPFTQEGGILVQESNAGRYSDNQFVVIPEVNANLSYCLTDRLKLTAGYSLIYVSDVARAGDQIDYNVNGTQLQGPFAGPADPAFTFERDSLWVYGVNFGAQFDY